MASAIFSNAQRIIAQILNWLQSSLQTRIANLITDSFTSGIDRATNSGEGFLVVPGSNNTSVTPSVNVTLGGIAYDPLGNRIFISSTDTTIYNESNTTATTNDGLGNFILTPQSSGVINIPVTQNSANYIWINYLPTINTAAFTLNEITKAKIFYEQTDGYNIQVTTTNVPPNANSIFLASVTTTGGAVVFGNISQVGRTYYTILTGLIPLIPVSSGGTGKSSFTSGTVLYASGSTTITSSATQVNTAGYLIGTVVQTVSFTDTSQIITAHDTFYATNTTVSITPKASTHKIRVTVTGSLGASNIAQANGIATIFRGAVDLSGGSGFIEVDSENGSNPNPLGISAPACMVQLDSPGTTSSITYTVYIRAGSSLSNVIWGTASATKAYILLEEIAA